MDQLAIASTDRPLVKHFRAVVAVAGISLEVSPGTVFGLVGPDGAGKSTLIRMLATVLAPDSGDALIFGNSLVRDTEEVSARMGYMPQRFSMYPDLTITENVNFFARLRGVKKAERKERSAKLLEQMGLTPFAKRFAARLSGGMKQKLMLASVLMHEPDLLLLDEPTTGVDPVSRREFWEVIARLRADGKTIVVATPYMDEAERCDQLAFIDAGRITRQGTPAEIKAMVEGTLLSVLTTDPHETATVLRDARIAGVSSGHIFGDEVRILAKDSALAGERVREALHQAGIPYELNAINMDMESAFAVLAETAPVQEAADA
ncbi:MAG: ABC transporter ATP-binding protein [Propionibacteriaceae bacterium]|jgi:ABC-2 type transport system ATP-binding protein|nr:ABC transporter ATP-binding protein [Propionibacteriaceae bacterium]